MALARGRTPGSIYYGLEPNRRLASCARRSRDEHGDRASTLFPFAAGEGARAAWMESGFRNSIDRLRGASFECGAEEVQVVRLDDLFFSLSRLDVLKVDVEGYEYRVLRGAQRLIETFQPAVFVEFCPINALNTVGEAEEAFLTVRWLFEHGYRRVEILDRQDGKSGGVFDNRDDFRDFYLARHEPVSGQWQGICDLLATKQ